MTMLQNSLLLDEEYEYEELIVDFWTVRGLYNQEDITEAIALAMETFNYYNPNIPEEEIELHLLELWHEWFEERNSKHV